MENTTNQLTESELNKMRGNGDIEVIETPNVLKKEFEQISDSDFDEPNKLEGNNIMDQIMSAGLGDLAKTETGIEAVGRVVHETLITSSTTPYTITTGFRPMKIMAWTGLGTGVWNDTYVSDIIDNQFCYTQDGTASVRRDSFIGYFTISSIRFKVSNVTDNSFDITASSASQTLINIIAIP